MLPCPTKWRVVLKQWGQGKDDLERLGRSTLSGDMWRSPACFSALDWYQGFGGHKGNAWVPQGWMGIPTMVAFILIYTSVLHLSFQAYWTLLCLSSGSLSEGPWSCGRFLGLSSPTLVGHLPMKRWATLGVLLGNYYLFFSVYAHYFIKVLSLRIYFVFIQQVAKPL